MPSPVATDQYSISNSHGSHHGYDFAVPQGTAAISTVNGTVSSVRNIKDARGNYVSYGKLIVITDQQGRDHYYAHLSDFNVRVGQSVTAGAVVGWTGSTGNSTGPHLHYEVRDRHGRQVDPSPWISDGVIVQASARPNAAVARAGASRRPMRPMRALMAASLDMGSLLATRNNIQSILDIDGDDETLEDVLLQAEWDREALMRPFDVEPSEVEDVRPEIA